jgi:guanylate kinase
MADALASGLLFVISAPSGVGKTTLIQAVRRVLPELRFSVSCTTRFARPDEVDGVDYHFMGREEFLRGVAAGRFLEWAEVHGQFYGTDGTQVRKWLAAGDPVLLDIDVQGARQVRCMFPQAITVFILPPSLGSLEQRLNNRSTETPDQIAQRLGTARREIEAAPWYDYLVVNDLVEEAVADLVGIIRACRCLRVFQAPKVLDLLSPGSPATGGAS